MYQDDDLMAAALRLLESTYGQRRRLREALCNVTLLDGPRLAVYGDIHVLRVEMSKLVYLTRTYSVWGVKSRVSGPFGDGEFGEIMATVDRLLVFLHSRPLNPEEMTKPTFK